MIQLVCIDAKELTYATYKGQGNKREKVECAKFTRALLPDEVEEFRLDPKKFLGAVGYTETSGDQAA